MIVFEELGMPNWEKGSQVGDPRKPLEKRMLYSFGMPITRKTAALLVPFMQVAFTQCALATVHAILQCVNNFIGYPRRVYAILMALIFIFIVVKCYLK